MCLPFRAATRRATTGFAVMLRRVLTLLLLTGTGAALCAPTWAQNPPAAFTGNGGVREGTEPPPTYGSVRTPPPGSISGGKSLAERLKQFYLQRRQNPSVGNPQWSASGRSRDATAAGTLSPQNQIRAGGLPGQTDLSQQWQATTAPPRERDWSRSLADSPYRSYRRLGEEDIAAAQGSGSDAGQGNRVAVTRRSPASSAPQSVLPIGHSQDVSYRSNTGAGGATSGTVPAAFQPQTPGEIPELVPEQTTPDRYLLPQPPAQPHPNAWERFLHGLQTTPPLVRQQLYGAATWIPGDGDDVGLFDFFIQGTFAVPWIYGFSLTPAFQVHFLDGPRRTDLPPRLYSARMEFRWQKQLGQRFGVDLSVAPGVYSDFEQGDSDSFRIMGRALGLYQWSVYSQFVFGIVYLDREDVKLIPAVGWIYVPGEDWRFEFVFPRPKIARRIAQRELYSRWCYVMGEFGGGSWSVERQSGRQDVVSYSDWRVLFGFEQRYVNGRSLFLEAGVVFNREIEFQSDVGNFDPSSTGLLRAGVAY